MSVFPTKKTQLPNRQEPPCSPFRRGYWQGQKGLEKLDSGSGQEFGGGCHILLMPTASLFYGSPPSD